MTKKRVIALGFFDGVHLGHAALLKRTRALADQLQLPAAAMTFQTHPDILVTGQPLGLLNTQQDRKALMQQLYAIDEVIFTPFDQAMMQMPWEAFIDTHLAQTLQAAHVVCGEDFRFGHRGQGTAQLLQRRCNALGIGCDVIPSVTLDGISVSSTYIRQLLRDGNIARANRFLGHTHQLTGVVVMGKQLGRTLGTPTANLILPPELLAPKFGVYAAQVQVGTQRYAAVANVGVQPTVSGTTVTAEPWILDFQGDLYGKTITIYFHEFLRGEQKFSTLEELKAEILRNAAQTRAYFQY